MPQGRVQGLPGCLNCRQVRAQEDFEALQASAHAERRELEQQRITLAAQRQKVLDAHYAGAIPLDLLKIEQERIASQLGHIDAQLRTTDANFEEARKILADTLDLARDCHAAYLEANDSTRRLFNQAFFSKIYIDEDPETRERSVRVDYNEPFGELLSRLVPARVHRELQTRSRAENKTSRPENRAGGHAFGSEVSEGQGCPPDTLVEVPGIEPGSSGGSTGLLRVQLTRKSQSPTLASSCSGTQPLNLSMLTPLAKVSYQAFLMTSGPGPKANSG
ncbi:MAG: recombinase family protein [Frankiales bacterium]|nr:recombinase family protein [Frankiales bacterium]